MPADGQDKEPLLPSTSQETLPSRNHVIKPPVIKSSRESNHRNHFEMPSSLDGTTSTSSSNHNFVRMIERNVDYIKGHFEEFFASQSSRSSLFVPVISFIILFLYVINTIAWHINESEEKEREMDLRHRSKVDPVVVEEDTDPAFDKHLPLLVKTLTISPGSLLIPYNWLWTGLSIVTYSFVELYFYQVVMDIVVLTLSTTLIDPLWGRKELYRFFLVVNVSVGILSTGHYTLIYAAKGDAVYLYGVTIYGLTGYLASVCVTIKQLLPDSVIVAVPSLGKFKNNHVPLSCLFLCWILYLLNLTSGVSVVTFFYGLITSWLYLRFVQYHPSNGRRGDLSNGFSFPTFFPNVLQPVVGFLSDGVYSFFVRIKVIPDYASGTRNANVSPTSVISKRKYKYHPSGDYDYLNNPPPEPTVVVGGASHVSHASLVRHLPSQVSVGNGSDVNTVPTHDVAQPVAIDPSLTSVSNNVLTPQSNARNESDKIDLLM